MAHEASGVQNSANASKNAENMKKILKLGLVLFTVTAITGLILGAVNDITTEPIRLTQARLKAAALAAALPEADEFKAVDLPPASSGDGANTSKSVIIRDVQQGQSAGKPVGYCITVASSGYGGLIEIVVGINESGGLRAIRILSQSETPGLGAKAEQVLSGQFANKAVEKLVVVKRAPDAPDQIQAISGATITSDAVTLGVNSALEYWRNNLKGQRR
ncbi:MAG: RnfABCDGE type electron transport complex subunit G [Synergistaceae bacterium]|jgi:electron transport complex protein RnfG|nr:RnfABCDGE type electron transport complex subunit G [Synergistaceae bacterium]